MHFLERLEDERGIVIVDALGVAFLVARGDESGDVLGRTGLENLPSEEFRAVDFGVFRNDGLVPEVALGIEHRVVNFLEKTRAGEVVGEAAFAREDGEFERLAIDAELVAAELDDVAAIDEEFRLVADLFEGILLEGFEAGLEFVRADGIAEFVKFCDEVAELGDHGIGGEPTVDFRGLGEGGEAAADAGEDALGGLGEGLATAAEGIGEGLAAGLEGGLGFLALGDELGGVFVKIGETGFHFLDLDHDAGERLITFFRGGGDFEIVEQALAEEAELGVELGGTFGFCEIRAAIAQGAADLIELGKEGGDALDDAGGLGGVFDFEAADDGGEHFQFTTGLGESCFNFLGLGDLGEGGNELLLGGDLAAVGIERGGLEQEINAFFAEFIDSLGDGLVHGIDLAGIGVADLAEGDDVAAKLAEGGEQLHEAEDIFRGGVGGGVEVFSDLGLERGGLIRSGLSHPADFFKLAEGGFCGGFDRDEGALQIMGLGLGEPEIAVCDVTGGADEFDVEAGK